MARPRIQPPILQIATILGITAVVAGGVSAEEAPPVGVAIDLIADTVALAPGVPFRAGIRIRHEPGFHTYWKAPGIVGVPTEVKWELPDGFRVSPLRWPAPEFTHMFHYRAFGYENDTVLVCDITPPDDLGAGSGVTLAAKVTFMACAETCHPGAVRRQLRIGTGTPAPSREASFLDAAEARVPRPLLGPAVAARVSGGALLVQLPLPPGRGTDGVLLLPETNRYDPNVPQTVSGAGDEARTAEVRVPLMEAITSPLPRTFSALAYHPDGWPQLDGARFGSIQIQLPPTP